jgi:DNA-binding NarL/FixJ family response regulator
MTKETAETTIRILMVEDHAVVQEGTRLLLDMQPGIEVVAVAENGEDALAQLEQTDTNLVLMDVAMPLMDGLEATRRIRVMRPELPVLILSAYDYDQYVFALIEAGAAGYLLKDVRGDQLVDAIRAVARGESVLHPVIARKVMRRFGGPGPGSADSSIETLSERELHVLRLAATGLGNDAIAIRLGVSPRTVQTHLSNVFSKMGVNSRTHAVIEALRRGWMDLEEIEG